MPVFGSCVPRTDKRLPAWPMLKLPARIYHARTGELFRLSITGNFVECAHSPSPSPRRLSYKVNLSSAPNKVASGPQKPRGIVGAQSPEVRGSWQRPDRLRDDPSRTV